MTSLEAYKKIKSMYKNGMCFSSVVNQQYKELNDLITKSLKALEIVKQHISIIDDKLFTDTAEWDLTSDEYDILKEVLR